MPDLLLELFSEEMPANVQKPASEELKKNIIDGFMDEAVSYSNATNFSTPQRICVVIEGLAAVSEQKIEVKRGPRVNAPGRAVKGFASSINLKVEDLNINEGKKGNYYFAELIQPAVKVGDLASNIIKDAILNLSWPKSMRWGSTKIKWVRPLRSILCILTYENESEIVPIKIGDIESCDETWGHRFMSPKKLKINSFETYEEKLRKNFVILNPTERAEVIWADANNLAFSQGLKIIRDDELLEEVSALVEWPSVLMGNIADKYLDLPSEILQTSMKNHQKFFSIINNKTDKIEKFITVANIDTLDNGKTILKGNQKVLDARLADGKFFFENDLRIAKDGGLVWIENLKHVVFHGKLGSQLDRVNRIEKMALKLAPFFNLNDDKITKAVGFSKIDLCSQMVYEFPELQGVMGKYYSEALGYDKDISQAILEHYQPLGPNDMAPTAPLSVVLALADKIDLISCFWSIDEKPTGSKDPYALRRASIGIIRLILSSNLKLNLRTILEDKVITNNVPKDEIIHFLHERLKILLRDQGIRHDAIDACVAMPDNDDFVTLKKRIIALDSFLATDGGANLLSGFKRANNILTAEEKKDGVRYELDPLIKYINNPYEKNLLLALDKVKPKIENALKKEDFVAAMSKTSDLRSAVDEFFKEVKVNDESQVIRRNRLCLLNSVKNVCCSVSDLTLIQDSNNQIDN